MSQPLALLDILNGGHLRFDMEEWLQLALDFSEITQSELARQLTKALGRAFDAAAINKMLGKSLKPNGKARKIQLDELAAIVQLTGFPAPKEFIDSITVPNQEKENSEAKISSKEPKVTQPLARAEFAAILQGALSHWLKDEKTILAASEMMLIIAENQPIETQTGNRIASIRKKALASILLYVPEDQK